jgi:hypothetical protein
MDKRAGSKNIGEAMQTVKGKNPPAGCAREEGYEKPRRREIKNPTIYLPALT